MTLEDFNDLNYEDRSQLLFKCCGSTVWSMKLSHEAPFNSILELKYKSDLVWKQCNESDFMEAFSHHPKIGDRASLEKKFASTKEWASGEQASVSAATVDVLTELKQGNDLYENKFGFIFIVCATGKTALEMLALLNQRLSNSTEVEINNAAVEQNKITHLRIDKLFL